MWQCNYHKASSSRVIMLMSWHLSEHRNLSEWQKLMVGEHFQINYSFTCTTNFSCVIRKNSKLSIVVATGNVWLDVCLLTLCFNLILSLKMMKSFFFRFRNMLETWNLKKHTSEIANHRFSSNIPLNSSSILTFCRVNKKKFFTLVL